MPTYLDSFNRLVSFGSILLQILSICFIVAFVTGKRKANFFLMFFKQYAFIIGFIVALSSVLLSLFYSNVIGFPPCELCWINRIFIYPQLILFSMELWKKDKTMVDFSIALAILSIVTSLYHVYIEHGGSSTLPCAANVVAGASCATRYVYEFSYVTIPVMALSASTFLLLLMLNYKKNK